MHRMWGNERRNENKQYESCMLSRLLNTGTPTGFVSDIITTIDLMSKLSEFVIFYGSFIN